MFQDTQPAPLGDAADGLDDFRVGSGREVAALLRRLLDAGTTLILGAPNGAHVRTTLWTVDTIRERLAFTADRHDPQVQSLLDAGEAVAVGYLDSVKLQFDVGSMLLVHGAASSVLQAPLPREMFRFQRRQSFRVKPARGSAVVARLRHPAMPEMVLTLRVLDISVGGCALFLPHNVPTFPAGGRLHGVQLELDAGTRIRGSLEVHHVTSLGTPDGVRLGCSLHDLDADAQRALQRYVDQTQKRSRVLSAG
jgi:c-di-GMP-binding flagellar brake protein YcgR